jgi:hypothetical protein
LQDFRSILFFCLKNEGLTELNSDLSSKQNKEWKSLSPTSGSTTHFIVPNDATEVHILALLYVNNANRSLKFNIIDKDLLISQTIYNGYYDGAIPVSCSLEINSSNREIGVNPFVFGSTTGTPLVNVYYR